MATFNYTIPNSATSRVVDAFAGLYDYEKAKLRDETKAQFAERQIKLFIKRTVARYEAAEAGKAASRAAESAAMSEIEIT